MISEKNQKIVAKMLERTSYTFSKVAANSKCMCIFHQPVKPKELSKLSKFNHA